MGDITVKKDTSQSPIGDFEKYVRDNPFMEYCRIGICSVCTDGSSEISVTLAPELLNLHGTIHGGLLYTLADCVAGISARSDGNDYITESAHINFLRSAKSGTVFASGEIVKRGGHMTVVRVTIYDEGGRLLSDSSVTLVKMEKRGQ